MVGRAELLSAIFFLGCVLSHQRGQSSLKVIGLACVGFLCKEQCLMALPMLALTDVLSFYVPTTPCSQPKFRQNQNNNWIMTSSKLSPKHRKRKSPGRTPLLYCLAFLAALLLRSWLSGRASHNEALVLSTPSFSRFDNPAAVESPTVQLLSYAYLSAFHFFTMLIPLRLSCDWSHSSLPVIRSFLAPENILTGLFLATLIGLVLVARRNRQVSLTFSGPSFPEIDSVSLPSLSVKRSLSFLSPSIDR